MNIEQNLLYLNKTFKILHAEQEFIVHPAAFGLIPLTAGALECSFGSSFQIKDYRLYLDKLTLIAEKNLNSIGSVTNNCEQQFLPQDLTISYNGAILIGADLVNEYTLKSIKNPCFSYQKVYELVFEDGVLITTIDQSKAMLRIRKNLELGLRSLTKKRDIRCIKRFINSSFVGDYKSFFFQNSRFRYLKEMKNDYPTNDKIKQITCNE